MRRVGVVGAGTMGSGIAHVCAVCGCDVVLYDTTEEFLRRGLYRIARQMDDAVSRNRLSASARDAARARIVPTLDLNAFAGCDLVIEAAPEDLAIKQEIFRTLDALADDAILASNTSSLSITELAAVTRRPGRVAGLHFFNPAHILPLVEVVRGEATSDETVAALVAFCRRIEKTPVVAADTPGFIVNRVARPFYGEALRIVGEGLADVATVDSAVRDGGGFRMGPFELMDLIGIDVNFAVTRSVYEAFFGEPRYRPHPIQRRMVASGRLGRKTGRGFYEYGNAQRTPPPLLEPQQAPAGPYAVCGGEMADELTEHLRGRGHAVLRPLRGQPPRGVAAVFVVEPDRGSMREWIGAVDDGDPGVPVLAGCLTASRAEVASWSQLPQRVHGFVALPPLRDRGVVEWIGCGEPPATLWALGLPALRVGDAPGGILARILAMLVNEAAFAYAEGVASAAEIDTAMRLGTNYPRGPFRWAEDIGVGLVAGILAALHGYYGEERYRTAPLLRRAALAGRWPSEIGGGEG
ncbi:MAG: 3-hydroxyacyl-CoA dehydrogenase NAD-binding domain-containing protein [Armatimonadota bacterium]|nr:3-hydroxyacyl-CoA dehydrogenase NAD-binding domain-containing protein [Armatimonadota bacterium]MDR5697494.1 3-hydroxyacyl-CoA dehydrogenase NAD-binding domain-containing protein [Armatimonadota bacterium]